MYVTIIDYNKRISREYLPQIEEVLNDTTICIAEEDRKKLNSMRDCCIAELGVSFVEWQLLDKYQKMIHPPILQEPQLDEFTQRWSDSVLKTARLIYLFVMIFGVIFVDRLWIWLVATVIYVGYVNNHKHNLRK